MILGNLGTKYLSATRTGPNKNLFDDDDDDADNDV